MTASRNSPNSAVRFVIDLVQKLLQSHPFYRRGFLVYVACKMLRDRAVLIMDMVYKVCCMSSRVNKSHAVVSNDHVIWVW